MIIQKIYQVVKKWKTMLTIVNTLRDLQSTDVTCFTGGELYYMKGRTSVDDGGQGTFIWITGDKSTEVSADEVTSSRGDGGIWISQMRDLRGVRGAWKRLFTGETNVKWWGAIGDGVTNDSTALSKCFSSASALDLSVRVDEGDYACCTTIGSGGSGSLKLYMHPAARLFATANMDSLLNLEPGLQSFQLRGGVFDANGFLKRTRDYLIAGISQSLGDEFKLASEVPAVVDIEDTVFRGDVGEQSCRRKVGGHIHLEIDEASADIDRYVRIVGNRFEGFSNDYTTSITIHGRNQIIFTRVIVRDNFFTNVKAMAYIKHYRYCNFSENTGRIIKKFGLFTMNNNDLLRSEENLEPDNNLSLLIHGNAIDTFGIALHIGASSGPYKVTHNNIYGLDLASGDNTLINDNSIRATDNTDDGGNFRSYGTYQGNTVKNAGRWGMNCNGTEVQILDNQFINCKEASLAVRGSHAFQNIIDRNLFNGAPLLLWNGSEPGTVPSSHARLQILGENNQFLNIIGEPIIIDETSLGSVNMWTRRPAVAKTWSVATVSDKVGVLGDIVLLDTRSNAVAYELPSTQKVGPGQRVIIAHDIGTNPATVVALNEDADSVDVHIANNTIRLTPKVDAWTSIRSETGKAIRIANNGGILPEPLVAGIPYFLILNVDPADQKIISLADTETDAEAGNAIDLISTGSGTYGDILYDNSGSHVRAITLSTTQLAVFISGRGCWYQV